MLMRFVAVLAAAAAMMFAVPAAAQGGGGPPAKPEIETFKGVAADPIIEALGVLTVDPLPLQQLTAHRTEASQLVDKVGFDN